MGVGVDVESLFPSSQYNHGPGAVNSSPGIYRRTWATAVLLAIRKAFNWDNIPWEDPSEISGLSTSMGNGRYNLFLSLAWAIEDLEGDPDVHITSLIDTVAKTRRSASEYQYPQLRNNCRIFPHLLDRDIYTSYYLPVDFAFPLYLPDPLEENTEYSIGSSHRLLSEVEILLPLMTRIVSIAGEKTYVLSYSYYSWGDVHDVALTLKKAAQDSIRLNLPLSIRW